MASCHRSLSGAQRGGSVGSVGSGVRLQTPGAACSDHEAVLDPTWQI